VGPLFSAIILFFTVTTAVAIGILAAYGMITGILFAFAHARKEQTPAMPVLVPSSNHASGD
jgi:cation transporter-like permease